MIWPQFHHNQLLLVRVLASFLLLGFFAFETGILQPIYPRINLENSIHTSLHIHAINVLNPPNEILLLNNLREIQSVENSFQNRPRWRQTRHAFSESHHLAFEQELGLESASLRRLNQRCDRLLKFFHKILNVRLRISRRNGVEQTGDQLTRNEPGSVIGLINARTLNLSGERRGVTGTECSLARVTDLGELSFIDGGNLRKLFFTR